MLKMIGLKVVKATRVAELEAAVSCEVSKTKSSPPPGQKAETYK
jgi:hypothetical protein